MSWEQYLAIMNQARREAEQEAMLPPAACPNDGEPLETGPQGELHCRFDGWIWDGNPASKQP